MYGKENCVKILKDTDNKEGVTEVTPSSLLHLNGSVTTDSVSTHSHTDQVEIECKQIQTPSSVYIKVWA